MTVKPSGKAKEIFAKQKTKSKVIKRKAKRHPRDVRLEEAEERGRKNALKAIAEYKDILRKRGKKLQKSEMKLM